MKRAACLGCLAAVVSLVAVACSPSVKDMWNPTPTPSSSPTGTGTPIPGLHISTNTTWPTAYAMTATMTIDPGITLTIDSGSTISAGQGATLYVQGALDVKGLIAGSAGTPTLFQADGGASYWGGIDVTPGGVATIRNARLTGYSNGVVTEAGALTSRLYKVTFDGFGTPVRISADLKLCRAKLINGASGLSGDAGTLTIVDSNIGSGSNNDATSLSGASLVMDHSSDGVGTSPAGSNHCLIHSFGNGATVTVTKSVFFAGSYLVDLGGTTVTITQSNIAANPTIGGYDRQGNNTVTATSDYWNGATPPANWTTSPILPSPVADAGPRPYGSGCESDVSF